MFSNHRSALAQVNTIKMSGPVWAAMATWASWQPAELGFLNHGCWLIDDCQQEKNDQFFLRLMSLLLLSDYVNIQWEMTAWKVGQRWGCYAKCSVCKFLNTAAKWTFFFSKCELSTYFSHSQIIKGTKPLSLWRKKNSLAKDAGSWSGLC